MSSISIKNKLCLLLTLLLFTISPANSTSSSNNAEYIHPVYKQSKGSWLEDCQEPSEQNEFMCSETLWLWFETFSYKAEYLLMNNTNYFYEKAEDHKARLMLYKLQHGFCPFVLSEERSQEPTRIYYDFIDYLNQPNTLPRYKADRSKEWNKGHFTAFTIKAFKMFLYKRYNPLNCENYAYKPSQKKMQQPIVSYADFHRSCIKTSSNRNGCVERIKEQLVAAYLQVFGSSSLYQIPSPRKMSEQLGFCDKDLAFKPSNELFNEFSAYWKKLNQEQKDKVEAHRYKWAKQNKTVYTPLKPEDNRGYELIRFSSAVHLFMVFLQEDYPPENCQKYEGMNKTEIPYFW